MGRGGSLGAQDGNSSPPGNDVLWRSQHLEAPGFGQTSTWAGGRFPAVAEALATLGHGCSRQRTFCSSFCLSFFLKSVILKLRWEGQGDLTPTGAHTSHRRSLLLPRRVRGAALPPCAVLPCLALSCSSRLGPSPRTEKGLATCPRSASHSASAGTCTQTQAVRSRPRAFPKSGFLLCPDS